MEAPEASAVGSDPPQEASESSSIQCKEENAESHDEHQNSNDSKKVSDTQAETNNSSQINDNNDNEEDSNSDDLDEDKPDPYSFESDEDENANNSTLGDDGEESIKAEEIEDPAGVRRPDSSCDLNEDDEDRLVIADEDEDTSSTVVKRDPLNLKENVLNFKTDKPRKKHLRFNGMPEEEVAKKLLPDLISEDLDILIIGINPGLYAAFKGHHYAGPGNHFWKCMFLGGLTPKSMCADDDYKLLDHGIGFTNVVMRATRGSANLTRKEIEEGSQVLIDKIKKYKPRIAVFNGKGIYEVFSGQREFHFGKQPEKISDTDTHVWVMPNSSARCAQLPRAVDKVPFYSALKKFRDFLKGEISELDEKEVVFADLKLTNFRDGSPKVKMNSEFKTMDSSDSSDLSVDIRFDPFTGRKRRGRPPKPRADGSLPPPKRRVVDENGRPIPRGSNPIDPATGRKKRGRPKKADVLAAQAAFDVEHGLKSSSAADCLNLDGMKTKNRESIDSVSEAAGFLGNVQGDSKVEAAAQPPQTNQPVRPLPSFNSMTSMHSTDQTDVDELKTEDVSVASVNPTAINGTGCETEQSVPPSGAASIEDHRHQRLFNEAVHNEQQQQQQMQSSPTLNQAGQHHPYSNFAAGAGAAPNSGGYKSNTFSPNFNYANGSPLHSTAAAAAAAAAAEAAQAGAGFEQRMKAVGGNVDVTTKSITGLESLVDQIPAVAENDSGVFSGSGAGSHPNTPRSVGPYSPATAGQVGSNFHTSPFHTPPTNHFNVPSTSDMASANAATSSAENSTNFHPPTDFSVNSLVHHHHQRSMASEAAQAAGLTPPTPSTFSDSSFSVTSLTSSYANDMAAKYANPYTSSFLGSAASAASAGFNPSGFLGQPNSFMGAAAAAGAAAGSMGSTMSPMAMSYYGQYSNTYGAAASSAAAAASFAAASGGPSPYSAYMPNPGYPYSHYGQSPYSQSPYF